jgi:hypothetical protein
VSPQSVTVSLVDGPYAASGAHLRDELARIDILVRAQVLRWRMTIAASKPEELWGMVHVSEAEVEQYLAAPVTPVDAVPAAVVDAVAPFVQAEGEAAAQIRRNVEVTAASVALRLEQLRTRFGLAAAELDVVLLVLLPELDLRYRRIFGYLQDNASRAHPPVDLVWQILHAKVQTLEEKRSLFDPTGVLARWRLVSVSADEREVRLDPRVTSFLLGGDAVDGRLDAIVDVLPANVAFDDLFAPSATVDALRAFTGMTAVLRGAAGSGRSRAAAAIAHARGLGLLRFDVERALRDPAQWELLVTLASREARLRNAALYFDGLEKLDKDFTPDPGVVTFLATDLGGPEPRDTRSPRFDFPAPHFDLRRAIWRSVVPDAAAADSLAAAFQLNEGQIRDAAAASKSLALPELAESARRQSGRRLLGFARRIEPRGLKLDDVVLSDAGRTQLRELAARVRLRSRIETQMEISPAIAHGRGLLVLFTGPSGTGKTLAAEMIAGQQGVDLYKVDVSTVVSKWVGETEKNLSRVFADAEGSDALLFFDECDSLFGQRGEINEGSDRWANLQTNYLLQRVEDYSGVVILASNLRKNIDEAFLRRIQVIVQFDAPDAAHRLMIWQRSIAGSSNALSEEELREIANRFTITGGGIRNVAIDASYRALATGRTAVAVRDVVASVAREYQKLGRPITQGDFGERFYKWVLADVLAPPPAES